MKTISNKSKTVITVVALILAVLMIPLTLVIVAFGMPAQYDRTFYGGMRIKYERLKNVRGNKIVVIGGSSVAFGLRSDILEEETGLPVVNFGLYANLGTKYMLDVAEDYIREGDIVVIAPEQNSQALSKYYNAEAVWYSADGNFGVLQKIDGKNVGEMAKSFLKFTSGKFKNLVSGSKPKPDGIYNIDAFNTYGDIGYQRDYNVMPDGYDASMPVSYARSVIQDDFIDYLNGYRNSLVRKGARVYYSFCPVNAQALAEDDAQSVNDYYDYLTEKLDFAVLGNPHTHILDKDWFYDSNFHLNSPGAIYHTTILAQELKAECGDYSPIKTATVEKPQAPEKEGTSGSISEDLAEAAKIFRLSGVEIKTENGNVSFYGNWCIDGLTEYGKALSEITIPDTLSGIPVTTLSDNCFKDCASLTTLTIGKNIARIGKNTFSGCTSLTKIYVTSTDPNSYNVADNLLDGLDDCTVYVPQSAYSDYIFDYFWGHIHGIRPLVPYGGKAV